MEDFISSPSSSITLLSKEQNIGHCENAPVKTPVVQHHEESKGVSFSSLNNDGVSDMKNEKKGNLSTKKENIKKTCPSKPIILPIILPPQCDDNLGTIIYSHSFDESKLLQYAGMTKEMIHNSRMTETYDNNSEWEYMIDNCFLCMFIKKNWVRLTKTGTIFNDIFQHVDNSVKAPGPPENNTNSINNKKINDVDDSMNDDEDENTISTNTKDDRITTDNKTVETFDGMIKIKKSVCDIACTIIEQILNKIIYATPKKAGVKVNIDSSTQYEEQFINILMSAIQKNSTNKIIIVNLEIEYIVTNITKTDKSQVNLL